MEKIVNVDSICQLLHANFIDIKKNKKPELGSKVLVKIVYPNGFVDYNVAIYAICGYDKRKKGFYQNDDRFLNDGIMDTHTWQYDRVDGWFPLNCKSK